MGGSRRNRREASDGQTEAATATSVDMAFAEVDAWIGRLNQKVQDLLLQRDSTTDRVCLEAVDKDDMEVQLENGHRSILISFTINGLNQTVQIGMWTLLSADQDMITARTTTLKEGVSRTAVFNQKDLVAGQNYKLSFHRGKPVGARES